MGADINDLLEKKYLNPEHLVGFENYKYSSQDTSPLSKYVMHPFWNTIVKICPRTIAPNVLTFVGFLHTVANFVLLTVYDYSYYGASVVPPGDKYPPIPQWVWFVLALNQFLAHTLDGIDGKQARRTNTSGPLGEMFDHGLDSWAAFFIPACLWSVFGRLDYSISSVRFYFVLCNVLICFYSSHWEKYLTKVLFLPWGYDISQVMIFFIYIITGTFGTDIWKFDILPGVPSGMIFEMMLYCGSLVSSLPVSFYNVYRSYADKTGKMLSPVEAVRPLFGPLMLFATCTIWVMYSPTNIVDRDPRLFMFLIGVVFSNINDSQIFFIYSPTNIVDRDPRLFMFLIGVVFSNINCRLIVSQMSSTRCELLHWVLVPMFLSMILAFLLPSLEMIILILLTITMTAAHIHYGVQVVRQMCDHFHIRCFSIKDRID